MLTKKQRNKLIDLMRARRPRSDEKVARVLTENPQGFFDAAVEMLEAGEVENPRHRRGLLYVLWRLRACDHDDRFIGSLRLAIDSRDVEVRSDAAHMAATIVAQNGHGDGHPLTRLVGDALASGVDESTEEFLQRHVNRSAEGARGEPRRDYCRSCGATVLLDGSARSARCSRCAGPQRKPALPSRPPLWPLKLIAGFWLLASVTAVVRVTLGRDEPSKLLTAVFIAPIAWFALQGTRQGIRALAGLHGLASLGLAAAFFIPVPDPPAAFWLMIAGLAAFVVGSLVYLVWLLWRLRRL